MTTLTMNLNVMVKGKDYEDARDKILSAMHSIGIDFTIEDLWTDECYDSDEKICE